MPSSRSPRRFAHLAASVATLACLGGPAMASGDSCEPGLGLDFASRPRCANVSALSPGNDTRANLVLLLADRHRATPSTKPAPSPTVDWPEFRDRFDGDREHPAAGDYASGEGSRCRSEAGGQAAFDGAVSRATGLTEQERKDLIQARASLKPSCDGKDDAPRPDGPGLAGKAAAPFADYVAATAAFYAGRFADAATGFGAAAASTDPWLAETGAYMVARNALNRMQVDAFDQYGMPKADPSIDPALARAAEASLDAYLAKYPKGMYASSARGLQRRVFWLAGWTDRLTARYAELVAMPPDVRGITDADLADEIDGKLLPKLKPADTRDPTLLAVLDLWSLRKAGPGETVPPRADLEAQREAFASEPDLYSFLGAAYAFYGSNDPKAVTRSIPDDARRRGGNHLWFSRQFLRGLALEAVGDRNARGFWKELIPATTRPLDRSASELALALDDERRNDVADAFAPGSPVTNEAIRTVLLSHGAGPDLLRSRAADPSASRAERTVALDTLLRKEILRGRYADFISDLVSVPPGETVPDASGRRIPLAAYVSGGTAGDIGCPTLAETASRLARDPGSARGRLCLAEWMRLDADSEAYVEPRAKGDLGTGPSAFPGRSTTRGDIYAGIIADARAPAGDRAFALYRAVKCYEPSGMDHCGGAQAGKPERKRWYDTLRREYPDSRWARALRYWW